MSLHARPRDTDEPNEKRISSPRQVDVYTFDFPIVQTVCSIGYEWSRFFIYARGV